MKQQRLLRRLCRMLAGDDNPLRRDVDKLESAVITGLIVAFFIAAPLLAFFAAGVVGVAGTREMRAEQQWKPVPAVLKQSAAQGSIGLDGNWDTAWVKAQWTMPGGAAEEGPGGRGTQRASRPAGNSLGDAGRTAHARAADKG